MSHIGIEGLGGGHCEKDQPEHDETAPRCIKEQSDTADRIEGEKYARVLYDPPDAQQAAHGKPDQHHRSKGAGNCRRAAALHEKETDQQNERDRNDVGLKQRRHFQPFDRAQYRDRRGDDAVAIVQRGADHAGMIHKYCHPGLLVLRNTRPVSASSPPSLRLSARMVTRTYFMVTTSIKAQMMSKRVPRMACSLMSPKFTSDWRTA
jgi:hypothetical protein